MAERDLSNRLRRAVKENNLFLVRRLIQRTGMRNPDPVHKRYTSLAWAAALGNEETFEFLLTAGHDDEECSKDVENNTILHILADTKGASVTNPHRGAPGDPERADSAVRMAQLYWDRYPETLDWQNDKGRAALHVAALKGSDGLARIFCELGADVDLTDVDGNTPLHHASAWGHVAIIQLLVERGCQYTLRNNEGYTASDYAYSFNTKDTLQESARNQFELLKQNKKARRVAANLAANGSDWLPESPPPVPPKPSRDLSPLAHRGRSESAASWSTGTSDSGDRDHLGVLRHQQSQSSLSTTSSPSQVSVPGPSPFRGPSSNASSSQTTAHSPAPSSSSLFPSQPNGTHTTLSPVATRMRERDADAMEKYYMNSRVRQRSGSADTTPPAVHMSTNGTTWAGSPPTTDPRFVSAGPSSNGDDITALANLNLAGVAPPRRRLRPSASASQINSQAASPNNTASPSGQASRDPSMIRTRAGTGPAELTLKQPEVQSPVGLTPPPDRVVFHSPSTAASNRSYTGPPAEYARFPEPAVEPAALKTPTQPMTTRSRLPFKLSKSGSAEQGSNGHRRGSSGTASPISPPSLASIIRS